ncbi:MAG: response regulator [Magnetococcales bacterium]|nr:response regulator [Magnetococcales bacterium]
MDENSKKQTLLLVDDTPAHIDVLVANLGQEYRLLIARDGLSALKIVTHGSSLPDLILLDVRMPEMDGYEVCRQLKQMEKIREVPVIFVTAEAEIEDEAKGFAAGGVDYITKPVSPPILKARVKTHLALLDARQSVQKLLQETLAGTIHLLTEVLALANPVAFRRTSRIKRLVRHMAKGIDRVDSWQFELAAGLSQLGCITLPGATLKRIFGEGNVSKKELDRFAAHPGIGSRLLERIPRLEKVAQMIAEQNEPRPGPFWDDPKERNAGVLGSQLIKMAFDFERQRTKGVPPEEIIQKMGRKPDLFDPALVKILASHPDFQSNERRVTLKELTTDMIIIQDVLSQSGEKILLKGTEVTPPILEFITASAGDEGIQEPLLVQLVSS